MKMKSVLTVFSKTDTPKGNFAVRTNYLLHHITDLWWIHSWGNIRKHTILI